MTVRRLLIAMGIGMVLVGGYLAASHLSGGAIPTLGMPVGGDMAEIRANTVAFWEDLQFKDYQAAAAYHDPATRESVDIPYLIERAFVVKPELLEIVSYEVVLAEVDSTGDRVRVKTRVVAKSLARGDVIDKEVQLFWHRAGPDAPWYMVLEDSLRRPVAAEGKRH